MVRDELMQAMLKERPDSHYWVSLPIISKHFAGIVGGVDVDSLKKAIGRHWASFLSENLFCVQYGKGRHCYYMKGLSSTRSDT